MNTVVQPFKVGGLGTDVLPLPEELLLVEVEQGTGGSLLPSSWFLLSILMLRQGGANGH